MKVDFSLKFLQHGGLLFLCDLFQSVIKSSLEKDIIKTKMVTVLLRVLSALFMVSKNPPFKDAATPQILDILVKETLAVYQSYIKSVFEQQSSPVSGDTRQLKKETNIMSFSLQFLNKAIQYNHKQVETFFSFPNIQTIIRTALIDIEVRII
jgi:hypothetical protein